MIITIKASTAAQEGVNTLGSDECYAVVYIAGAHYSRRSSRISMMEGAFDDVGDICKRLTADNAGMVYEIQKPNAWEMNQWKYARAPLGYKGPLVYVYDDTFKPNSWNGWQK